MRVLPRPRRRELEFPGIKVAARRSAGSERGAGPGPGASGRRPRAPAAGDGRDGNKWLGRCGLNPAIQLSCRAAGEQREEGREAGREGAVSDSGYRVREWSGAPPRLGLSSPPDRPPRAACSGPGHRRVSPPARRLIRGAPAALRSLGPPDRRSPAATSGAPRTRTRRTPNVPRLCTPALHSRGRPPRPAGSAPGSRRTRSLATHRASRPRPSLPSHSRRSSPRSTFPRCLRPARPPPQTPPPDAPSRTSAAPSPARASARPHPDAQPGPQAPAPPRP